nr:MAG TPA: hypothetical protein [Caudoviricetes sp.]
MSENKWEVADSYNPWGKKRIHYYCKCDCHKEDSNERE